MKPPIEYISKTNKRNIVIFIHGFTSNSSTWSNSKKKTLPKMLLDEEIIKENFDMGYFNYFTELIDFKKPRFCKGIVNIIMGRQSKSKKNIGIKGLKDHLASSLKIYCAEYENIIIIAHSMGGLVSKAYILEELGGSVEAKVKLFISLAVPHKGSDWANIGSKLVRKNPQVLDLKPLSDFLDKTNSEWVNQGDNIPKTIYYYGQYDEIVKEKNAISFQTEEKLKVACNYDHFDICKPETKDSIVYQGIKKDLICFLKEVNYVNELESEVFVDDGELDNELFVLKLLIADIHERLIFDSKKTFYDAEYMVKAIERKGYGLEDLNNLYSSIERLYSINFVKFSKGIIKSSDELLLEIYESIIDKDREFLKTAIPLIEANEKTGMLNQLSNNLERDIWWAKNQSIKDIDELRKERCNNDK